MKTQVTFRSNKFPPYDGEQEQINPGLWGRRLAEFFVEQLKETEFETETIIPEDWGWYVPIRNDGFRLGICCGHQNGEDDEFLCFTEPDKPIIRKLFRKIDVTQQLTRLTDVMDRILRADPEIRCVEWSES